MDTFVSFPSDQFEVMYELQGLTQDILRTSDDLFHSFVNGDNPFVDAGHLVMDRRHSVIDTSHLIFDTSNSIIDANHLIIDGPHRIRNSLYPLVNSMRRLQILCSRHPSFFLRQLVQSLQRILYLRLANQLLRVFF